MEGSRKISSLLKKKCRKTPKDIQEPQESLLMERGSIATSAIYYLLFTVPGFFVGLSRNDFLFSEQNGKAGFKISIHW